MLDSKKIKEKSVDSTLFRSSTKSVETTLLPVGFVSRNQIIEMYGVSQASLTKYIRNNNFPTCRPHLIKSTGKNISTFKESEVSEWFAYKNKYITSDVIHPKLDIDLNLRFLRGQI
jgi:predicted DNA-binding transcriptional regulator AlpA